MSNTIQIVKVSECKIVTIILNIIIHHGDHDLLLYHLSVVQLEWIKRVGMLLDLPNETDLPSDERDCPEVFALLLYLQAAHMYGLFQIYAQGNLFAIIALS